MKDAEALLPNSDNTKREIGAVLRKLFNLLPTFHGDYNELLHASILNCKAMERWGRIRIVWVDNVASHLDFNRAKRQVSIFAHPGFSALWCTDEPKKGVFDRYG